MSKPIEENFVPRVTQLDAVELDNEVIQVMKSQVVTAGKYLKIGFVGQWEPEIDALLRILIWKYSVNRLYGTFGQQLLDVKYGGKFSKEKAWLSAVLTIGTKYLGDRSNEISHLTKNEESSRLIKKGLEWSSTSIQIASFINLLVFFQEGKYPTLADRVLGLRPVSTADPRQSRSIGYSFMLRELLWHGFIELLVFTLPLINYHYIRRKLINMFTWQKSRLRSVPVVSFTPSTKCAICRESPILPHSMGCTHIFCFYCIKANHLADPKFECPLCGFSNEDAKSIIPLQIAVST